MSPGRVQPDTGAAAGPAGRCCLGVVAFVRVAVEPVAGRACRTPKRHGAFARPTLVAQDWTSRCYRLVSVPPAARECAPQRGREGNTLRRLHGTWAWVGPSRLLQVRASGQARVSPVCARLRAVRSHAGGSRAAGGGGGSAWRLRSGGPGTRLSPAAPRHPRAGSTPTFVVSARRNLFHVGPRGVFEVARASRKLGPRRACVDFSHASTSVQNAVSCASTSMARSPSRFS